MDCGDAHLCCPNCTRVGKIVFFPDLWNVQLATCGFCGYKLRVHSGIPDFAEHLPLADPKLKPAQKLMHSRFFASIYETPIWRPLHTRIGSGISMEQEVQEVLAASGTVSARAVADLACGTGHYARAFAQKLPEARVYGLDISLNMLVKGGKLAQRERLTNIVFLRGDIHRLPFDDKSVENVNCGGALHLFPDVRPIWREVSRVLKPGGVFTGMTIASVSGIIGRMQRWVVGRGRATFFHPDQLGADLSAVGLYSYMYRQHRVLLLFRAAKDPAGTGVPGV